MRRSISSALAPALAAAVLACMLLACSMPSSTVSPGVSGNPPPPTAGGVPRWDHVVVVVEENHSASEVAGSPYLDALAARGASLGAMLGVTHPSEPNYFALFSGSTQGVTDDGTYDLSAPNLATNLASAGLSFADYSEGLPSTGSTVAASGAYARKHNPAASFTNVPSADNLPFRMFPSDFTRLPTVSFVIPDLDDDMHDGSVAQGDAWLQANLDGYAGWAPSHRSLLVVTFDEPDVSAPVGTTPIYTTLVGASVAHTVSTQPANLYSLLRLIETSYGLLPTGQEGSAPQISGIWS